MKTPDTLHLKNVEYKTVYEPAEDTFLLLDALESEIGFIKQIEPTICAEIGPGSGCVSTFLAQLLDPYRVFVFGFDINKMACECTLKTATVERVRDRIDTIRSFFTSGLHRRIYGSVDILVFNPPYVPTDSEEAIPEPSRIGCDKDCSSDKEMVESLMAASWAGGVDGREVMDNFFPHVNKLLSAKGVFYLVLVDQNRPSEVIATFKDLYSLHGKIIASRRAGRENLHILKFQRIPIL